MSPCWETIAECMEEMRSQGPQVKEAVSHLSEELSRIALDDSVVMYGIKEFLDSIESDQQSGHIVVQDLFNALAHLADFRWEFSKITAAKLLGRRSS